MFLKIMCSQPIFCFVLFFFQSHQKWHQQGGKNEVQFITQAAETFLGHGRCFCLGAKMFSFEITKQHHRLLGDFVLLVIWRHTYVFVSANYLGKCILFTCSEGALRLRCLNRKFGANKMSLLWTPGQVMMGTNTLKSQNLKKDSHFVRHW